MKLNFGHTFGHAIETNQGYGEWLHGEAVAAGMVMAADLSYRLGWLSLDIVERVRKLIVAAHLPVLAPAGMTAKGFLDAMLIDKKNVQGSIRLVLLKALGEAVVTENFDKDLMVKTIESNIGQVAWPDFHE